VEQRGDGAAGVRIDLRLEPRLDDGGIDAGARDRGADPEDHQHREREKNARPELRDFEAVREGRDHEWVASGGILPCAAERSRTEVMRRAAAGYFAAGASSAASNLPVSSTLPPAFSIFSRAPALMASTLTLIVLVSSPSPRT